MLFTLIKQRKRKLMDESLRYFESYALESVEKCVLASSNAELTSIQNCLTDPYE